jgi:hypothetical protein
MRAQRPIELEYEHDHVTGVSRFTFVKGERVERTGPKSGMRAAIGNIRISALPDGGFHVHVSSIELSRRMRPSSPFSSAIDHFFGHPSMDDYMDAENRAGDGSVQEVHPDAAQRTLQEVIPRLHLKLPELGHEHFELAKAFKEQVQAKMRRKYGVAPT